MSVSMNFIVQLPQVQGYNGIMVVVDLPNFSLRMW